MAWWSAIVYALAGIGVFSLISTIAGAISPGTTAAGAPTITVDTQAIMAGVSAAMTAILPVLLPIMMIAMMFNMITGMFR